MTVTGRLFDLLAYLQTGRRFSGAELAARLQTSPRTVRRDVQRLREFGYPVTTQPGPGGFYRLSAGRALPPLVFDDDEAIATVVGLGLLAATTSPERPADADSDIGGAAARAYGKIDQLLPKRLRPRTIAVRATVEAAAVDAPAVEAARLATLARAAAGREQLNFGYRSRSGASGRRRVQPYRQVYRHLRWYLLAWDLDRADWRTFRIDRIDDIVCTGIYFEPRPLPAESAAAYLHREHTAGRYRAVVTVDAPAAVVADILRFQDCAIDPIDAQRCLLTTWVDSFEWLILNLGLLDTDFTIEEPAEFHARCHALAARLGRAATRPDAADRGHGSIA